MKLRFITEASADANVMKLTSDSKGYEAICQLSSEYSIFSDIENALKIDKYIKQKNVSQLPESIQNIIGNKQKEARRLLNEAKDKISDAVIKGTFYIDGNKIEGNNKVTADNWTDGVYAQLKNDEKVDFLWTEDAKESIRLKEPLDFGVITTYSADKAYEQVMNYAGCCNYRDEVDKRIISDTRKGTATFTGEGNKPGFINSPKDTGDSPWPELSIAGLSAPVDSDGDGIPDEWEIKNGLDPNNPVDGNTKTKDPNGQYTNLEVYLNSLVQHIVDAQNK